MKNFFKGPVFRALLALLALVVLSLIVWYLGPYLGVGELRPLASVGVRVSIIVMLLAMLVAWTLELSASLVWSVLGAAALCLVIWHGGPLLILGPLQPLEPVWARVMAIAIVLLVLVIWGMYKLYKALQNDEMLLQRWLRREDAKPALAKEEIRALSTRSRQALAQLRKMHMNMAGGTGSIWSGLRRLVEGKRYLYELPWYVLIGQPGAGKSSVVVNSGLRFPLADQMGAASALMKLEKASGTQNCDWWLTNDMVLLDTAGRYTDPGESVDEVTRQTNEAEWLGFLKVLRQVRPRAPVNGALLVVDVAQLVSESPQQRMAMAAQLRARLEELRTQLGIRFPVYLVLAKADVLRGFSAYFRSLTSEARAQVWGFTLPWKQNHSILSKLGGQSNKNASNRKAAAQAAAGSELPQSTLALQVQHEFENLVHRIEAGVANRLQEEFELDQRQALYLLPHELQGLLSPLQELVEAVFSASRYDTTQAEPMLRGVYLSSAMQSGTHVPAQPLSPLGRLRRAFTNFNEGSKKATPTAASLRSYFLTDLLQRVVLPEAHLVQPNLRWEARMRLLRWIGHGLVLAVFFWLTGALTLSYHNNSAYLQAVSEKTDILTTQMKLWLKDRSAAQTEKVLNQAQDLPQHLGLDLNNPALSYRYGLYHGDGIAEASQRGYAQLLDRLVLPQVIAHMEQVMQEAMTDGDSLLAYETLRVYLLLHDASKYAESPDSAREVRMWVTQQWQQAPKTELVENKNGALEQVRQTLPQRLGNNASMIRNLEWLFSGQRVVTSKVVRNETLVHRVRNYLGQSSSSERLYNRILSALEPRAPQEFSLIKALGPQIGSLFTRASGENLGQGIPGLFTYEGYHEVFAPQLATFLVKAQQDDAWAMGLMADDPQKKSEAIHSSAQRELVEEVRRQYLNEYASRWEEFLADIRLVRNDGSSTLAFDLSMLRQLVTADSPLVRLVRIAARETTLSTPLAQEEPDTSALGKAGEQLAQQKGKLDAKLGVRPEQRAEQQLVDDKFAALREMVGTSAQGRTSTAQGMGGAASGTSLSLVTNLLNEYYTLLVVADTAITSGSLPPSTTEIATKLRIEAGKTPEPLREILLEVSRSGTDKVTQGAAAILQVQARTQVDRLLSMMNSTVTQPCRRQLAGRYPFAESDQEVAADDFNSFFGANGAADVFFKKYMEPLVDTSMRPWRYKTQLSMAVQADGTFNPLAPAGAPNQGPTLQGEFLKLLAQSGPNPDTFATIAQIRDIFFRDANGQRMSWRGDYKILSLDPSVTEWVIDIDGQTQRYAHGPVQTLPIQWPGPRGGVMAEMFARPLIKTETSSFTRKGPWAWFRLVERGKLASGAQTGRQVVEFQFENRRAVMDVGSAGPSPFNNPLLRNFTCPGTSTGTGAGTGTGV